MRYVLHGVGGDTSANGLVIAETPIPQCGDDELLIRVRAAGVNRPDLMQREGRYPSPPGASPILGLEASGEVAALGRHVRGFHVGQRVCALCNGGAYADYVSVPASQCLVMPDGLGFIEAAAMPEAMFTVWANVFDAGRLAAGETLLIHGGASGIGTMAILMFVGDSDWEVPMLFPFAYFMLIACEDNVLNATNAVQGTLDRVINI